MPPLSRFETILTFARSTLFALLFYGLTVLLLIAAMIVRPFGQGAVGAVAESWARMHRLLIHRILGQKIAIEGSLPDNAKFIVCKHESMFETLDALCLFRRPIIAAKRELAQIPVWGSVARSYGLIIVDRKGGASALRAIRTEAQAAFAAGRPVILYPEGTRVTHGEEPPLKAGFAGLYGSLDCPVVPIAVDSGRLSPRNRFLKRPGTITYRIGEPIPAGLPRKEAEARVHAAINALNRQAAKTHSDSV